MDGIKPAHKTLTQEELAQQINEYRTLDRKVKSTWLSFTSSARSTITKRDEIATTLKNSPYATIV